jgi:tripartite-type tricarboxylate transporter receptor subunit TctC
MVAKTFGVIALRKDFPAQTVAEFIAYAKTNPGKINLGHAGIGSSNYLICKSFVQAANIDVALVGYRGAAPAPRQKPACPNSRRRAGTACSPPKARRPTSSPG